jgi:hypothetical protein
VKFVVVLSVLAFAAPASANEPQVGRWAADAQYCAGSGDTFQTAPLTVTPTSLRWASESCTIGKMYKADRALYIEAHCSSGATTTRHPVTLAMRGGHLAVTWNGAQTEMQRCP